MRRSLTAIVLVLGLGVGFTAPRVVTAESALPVQLTLSGPSTLNLDQPGYFSGRLTFSGLPLSNQEVEVLFESRVTAKGTTDLDGVFSMDIAIPRTGVRTLEAVSFRGSATEVRSPALAVTVVGPRVFTSIAGGWIHTCAVISTGTARCWGDNRLGQLGNGSRNGSSVPDLVLELRDVVSIATGSEHSCAILSDGTGRCWGNSANNQLGNGDGPLPGWTSLISGLSQCYSNLQNDSADYSCETRPVAVNGLEGATTVTAGVAHTCALISDGSARCWGWNAFGQLGNGNTNSGLSAVSGLTDAIAITANHAHTCALISDGTARCWGYNVTGQLGNGTTTTSLVPVVVWGLTNAIAITDGGFSVGADFGGAHTCALLADGSARCWGWNGYGQLGNGSMAASNVPISVAGLENATALASGGNHTCAVISDGTARCWGRNNYGQLGDGTRNNSSFPVAVSGLTGAVSIAAGWAHTCAIINDGTARCWGNNLGQLGTTSGPSTIPQTVAE